ncbi:unnamed protein product [Rotaria sp. Silwood1]|nr:unnamed protein product [Rotaria sp. Silwood1]
MPPKKGGGGTIKRADSLKENGFNVENVIRLTSKEKNYPTQTIKITFNDPQNRNTFVQTGLQIDSMHFTAKPAIQNSKPVQCYLCLKYNHVAKFCKTKQQLCARCGENHHYDQCPNTQVSPKCCNCIGEHLANLSDCPTYREQERRIHKTINQYSTTTKQTRTTTVPILNNNDEFPPLTNVYIRQHDISHNTMIDEILNILTFKMEKILEETTNRLLNIINQREFSNEGSRTSADEIAASEQLFEVLKSFKDSHFSELDVYQTLDFDDENDETTDKEQGTDEEESLDDTDDFDENQQQNIYNHFTLEEMEEIVEWVDQHPNYKFTTIKHRFQKLKKIKQFVWDEFYVKRAVEKEAVHDTDLEIFAIQKARELKWDNFITIRSHCTVIIHIDLDNVVLDIKDDHCHSSETEEILIRTFVQAVQTHAINECTPIPQICDEEAGRKDLSTLSIAV